MKKRKRRLDAGKEARRRARQTGLVPATTRVIEDKRRKKEKHRKNWVEQDQE